MQNRFQNIVFFILITAAVIEILFIKTLWQITLNMAPYAFWVVVSISAISFLVFSLLAFRLLRKSSDMESSVLYNAHYPSSGYFVLFFVPKLFVAITALLEDLIFFIWRIILHILQSFGAHLPWFERTYYFTGFSLVFSGLLFLAILYGIMKGKYNYTLRKVPLKSKKMKGSGVIKMVQISDFHIGSFLSKKEEVLKIVEMINSLEPDIVCFTGDLVNIFAKEAEPFISDLKKIKAKDGKFSILGNHDYGEYYPWPTQEAKDANLKKLKSIHQQAGFQLLMNEHVVLNHAHDSLVLAGVENWGEAPFPQYGDINLALDGVEHEKHPVVLLSHDPTHWDQEIKNHHPVDLTLSGHTHGMQFGIEWGKFKWSPVKLRYKKWAGLYTENQKQLYVNRGIGFIGFPGRVGIWPEITLFELSANNS